nr:uncharacterized protein LOC109784346 [Aegilops tauschii subsp. strangulata]
MVEEACELEAMTTEFYSNLYTSEGCTNMQAVLDSVPEKVTDEMRTMLDARYTEEEVKKALYQMFPTKSPGPDGFPAHFFQKHWGVCGTEVTAAVLKIIEGCESAESINQTYLVLIPKVKNPSLLSQFHPISLCNVFYKIASKVIANRLKLVLPEIISSEQSAFVPGRLITDNIIVAYECLHFMKRNRAVKHRHCALKLDMMKAYDRVEWDYLRAIMLKLGFSSRWVNIVMDLVSSVSYSVLFNGKKLQEFKPSRGIRQGDPISPYLFLLAAEGLSGLLKNLSESSQLGGIQVAPSAPPVNHLLFADDSLLFFKISGGGATEVSNLLETYCQASGQRINAAKSTIFFSKRCPSNLKEEIKGILNVPNETLNDKYLGMPSDVGSSKFGAFKYLKDRLWSKVKGWIEKTLSMAGKEVLVKSVAQAVPILKAVYFPNGTILTAELGSRPSQVWRAVLGGRDVLCQGIIRRMGDGSATRIWADNWIPRMDDFWAWSLEKNGNFTVRSAYRMLADTKRRREDWLEGNAGMSNYEAEAKSWTSLWSVQVPGKDSWRHSLMQCSVARCVWALVDDDVVDYIQATTELNAKRWLFSMFNDLPQASMVKLVVTLWAIWSARRKAIHEGVLQSPHATHAFVTSFISELESLKTPVCVVQNAAMTSSGVRHTSTWLAPAVGVVKIQVDGGQARNGRSGAAAALCRDHHGLYLGSSAMSFSDISDPATLEALACREALNLALDLSLEHIIIACDNKTVVADINNGTEGPYSAIIKEIRARARSFRSCEFIFEGRAGNTDAHNLAKFSSSLDVGRHLWLRVPHDQFVIPVNRSASP